MKRLKDASQGIASNSHALVPDFDAQTTVGETRFKSYFTPCGYGVFDCVVQQIADAILKVARIDGDDYLSIAVDRRRKSDSLGFDLFTDLLNGTPQRGADARSHRRVSIQWRAFDTLQHQQLGYLGGRVAQLVCPPHRFRHVFSADETVTDQPGSISIPVRAFS
jgi:hypothetical protein